MTRRPGCELMRAGCVTQAPRSPWLSFSVVSACCRSPMRSHAQAIMPKRVPSLLRPPITWVSEAAIRGVVPHSLSYGTLVFPYTAEPFSMILVEQASTLAIILARPHNSARHLVCMMHLVCMCSTTQIGSHSWLNGLARLQPRQM